MMNLPQGAGGYGWDHKVRRLPRSEQDRRKNVNREMRRKRRGKD